MPHKLALIGFGTVGQGLAEILRDKGEELRTRYGFEVQLVAITTASRGALYHPHGLDIGYLRHRLLGEVTLVGPGAGRRETGFALLADLLDIHRTQSNAVRW